MDIIDFLTIAFQNEDLRAALDNDHKTGDDYAPYWITKKERKALNSDIFVENRKGKLIVYKDRDKVGMDAYITKREILKRPEIKADAEDLIDVLDQYKFRAIEFEDKKFIAVKSEHNWQDSRLVFMTKAFQEIVKQRYDNSAYIVSNAKGLLLIFATNEDPDDIAKGILESNVYLKRTGFEVFRIDRNKLTSVIKFNSVS